MSQLDLSSAAGVTSRHVSFVETGRAAPSRSMLDTLADALAMPLRDRNDLYVAAGYAPPHRELGLDDEALGDAVVAIERILASHEPCPAVVMDRHWRLLRANVGAMRLFASMIDVGSLPTEPCVLELVFDEHGLKPHIANWEELAPALLDRARREAIGGVPDPELGALIDRLSAGIGEIDPAVGPGLGPLIDVRFVIDGEEHAFFSTVTTLGTPLDITLQELRIELFHPADDATRRRYATTR